MRNLRVTYGKALILDGIDLTVNQGELVSVIGPNGAGKTTLLRALSKVAPFDGIVSFKGREVSPLSPVALVQLGLVHCPEGRRLFPDLSVFENLALGAYLFKDNDRIAQDIEMVSEMFPILKERREQRAGTLSGGEQQMLAIARALMTRPSMLLLDEPSTGLSVMVKTVISEKIGEIQESGVTILLVEQDTQMAFDLAMRLYVLEHGRVALEGATKDVQANPYIKEVYLGMK